MNVVAVIKYQTLSKRAIHQFFVGSIVIIAALFSQNNVNQCVAVEENEEK